MGQWPIGQRRTDHGGMSEYPGASSWCCVRAQKAQEGIGFRGVEIDEGLVEPPTVLAGAPFHLPKCRPVEKATEKPNPEKVRTIAGARFEYAACQTGPGARF